MASTNTPDLTDGSSSTSADSRLCIPNPFPPTKIRVAVSVESKTRKKGPNFNSPLAGLLGGGRSRTNSPVPTSSPPKSPLKPALFSVRGSGGGGGGDLEEGLVDWKKVEDGDVSVDIDDELDGACVDALLGGAGSYDKVLATVR